MPKFSEKSKKKLLECHPDIQAILNELINRIDITVLCGFRDSYEQNKAFDSGLSKVKWPNGKHNKVPSEAVDIAPYVKGRGVVLDEKHCVFMAGHFMSIAHELHIPIRWGGDWDGDSNLSDQTFNDLCHFELKV